MKKKEYLEHLKKDTAIYIMLKTEGVIFTEKKAAALVSLVAIQDLST